MLKKRPSPSLQVLPIVAGGGIAMPLRSSSGYTGGRNQWRSRGFSSRPYAPADGMNDADREFPPDYNPRHRPFYVRPNSDRPFNHNQSFQPPPPAYANPNQQFAPPPLYNQNQQFQRRGPPQPNFHQNQQFGPPRLYNQGQQRPQFDRNKQFGPQEHTPQQPFGQFQSQQRFRQRPSKPLDYRNWEYAKPAPSPNCERFTILSYNILADYLAINHRSKLYFHIPQFILDWEFRKKNIMFELGLWSADILCFQEVDKFQDIEEDLKIRGYVGIWKMRTGEPLDGCAVFWRSSRFKLLYEEAIEFNKLGLRDNVAQICVFESLNEKSSAGSPPPACSEGGNKVIICNIHVLFNPKRGEIKLGQVRVLIDRAYATSKLWDDAPVILCGDFNSTPKSSLYNFISEQKLNVSELPRDMISGQNTAKVHPKRPFTSTFRPQQNDNPALENKEVQKEESCSTMPNLPTTSSDTTHKDENPTPKSEEGNVEQDAIKTSPDKLLKGIEEVSVSEDSNSFLSGLRGPGGPPRTSELLDTEPIVDKPFYDSSAWTPMEIEAATGNSECTTMEHPLALRSTYSEVEDYSGARDSNGEPQVTSYHRAFQGTVDYIWRSEGLQTVRVLAPIPKHVMELTHGLPTKRWGSDHIALVTELAFRKDMDHQISQVS